jgi:hypothetical protein
MNNLKEEHLINMDMDRAFDMFQKSYIKSTGKSWDKDKFISRAQGWEFYGDDNGFVAIRKQKSALIKLVGVAGSLKSIYKGIKEIQNTYSNYPIWGMVSINIANQLERIGGFIPVKVKSGIKNTIFLNLIKTMIPSSVFGGATITKLNNDGTLSFSHPDVGETNKILIGNKLYLDYFKDQLLNLKNVPDIVKNQVIGMLPENTSLSEEIYPNNTATLYHRTKKTENIEKIMSDGWSDSGSGLYGRGVYTTYILRDQMTESMFNYGKILLKFKYTGLDKLLVFELDEAKKIHGKNYKLIDQLKKLKVYDNLKSIDKDIDLVIDNHQYSLENSSSIKSSDIAQSMIEDYPILKDKLAGILYYGRRDGRCILVYPPAENLILLAYCISDNESDESELDWKNLQSSKIGDINFSKGMYGKPKLKIPIKINHVNLSDNLIDRIKYYKKNIANIDTSQSIDIISKINSNVELKIFIELYIKYNPDDGVNIIHYVKDKDKDAIAKIIINAKQNNLSDNNVYRLLSNAIDKDAIARSIGNNNINKLSDSNVSKLLDMAKDNDAITKLIINAKQGNLSDRNVSSLLYYAKDTDAITKLIINAKQNNLSDNNVYYLLSNAKDKDAMARIIINNKQNNLSDDNVHRLLDMAKDKDAIAKLIGNNNINKLSEANIYYLLNDAADKDAMARIIINAKQGNLSDNNVYRLLNSAKDKDAIVRIIINAKQGNLSDNNVYYLLSNAKDKDAIARIIINAKQNNLSDDNVYNLLDRATDKDAIVRIIGNNNINKLSDDNVYNLLDRATDKDAIVRIIGNNNINKLSDDNVYNLLERATDKDAMARIIGNNNINKLSDSKVYRLLSKKDIYLDILLKYISRDRLQNIIDSNKLNVQLPNMVAERHYKYKEYFKNL